MRVSLSLEGYALLKVAGRNQGLEGMRKELSGRFNKTARRNRRPLRRNRRSPSHATPWKPLSSGFPPL